MKASTAIVGIGQSDYSWSSGRSETALAVEAINRALDDAGLTSADVDGVVRFSEESTSPSELVSVIGLSPLTFSADDGNGGAFAPALIGHADAAIAQGRARVIIAFRAFNGRSGRRLSKPAASSVSIADTNIIKARGSSPIGGEFSGPYGLVSPAHGFALWTQAYMDRFGIAEEQMEQALETIVLTERRHAHHNPHALLREHPLTPTAYRASSYLAGPLRKADLCLESDGACALIVTSRERAVDCRHKPVYVLDAAQAIIGGYHQLFFMEEELPPRAPAGFVAGRLAHLGLGIKDIDVLGTYDAASPCVVFDIETLGLCEHGQGIEWVQAPTIPFNTSGGLLAEVYLQGMNHMIEIVRQLRGNANNQLPRAHLGLVSSSAAMSFTLLSREEGS